MSTIKQRLLTAEEFWQMQGDGKNIELVRGEVVKSKPPGRIHGEVVFALGALLRFWAKRGPGGYVATESGYVLSNEPDTGRGPDVSYVREDRLPPEGAPEAFWHGSPDLAVEVVSPSESTSDIAEKVRDFLQAGTPLVWVVYPRRGEVVVYTADGLARTHSGDEILEQPDVLPGFSCMVSEIFT